MTTPPTPNPAANDGIPEAPFSFQDLNVETAPMPGEFPPPDHTASKPKWWERKPKNSAPGTSRPRKVPKPAPKVPTGGLVKPLTQLYTSVGVSLMPFDPSCGKIIVDNAESCAIALDDLGKTNPAVRRALIAMVTTSALGAVIMAHAPIVMAIAMHHVPALRERQEKAVANIAEMLANMPRPESDE